MEGFLLQVDYDKLVNEYEINHLIYHRNHNQHRLSTWWKIFNIIHRSLRKILKKMIDIQNLKSTRTLERKKEEIREIVGYLIKKQIFKRAFYQYNGIIALGQYVTLGLALLGNLGAIHSILIKIEGMEKPRGKPVGKILEAPVAVPDQKEDIGDEIVMSSTIPNETKEEPTIDVFSSLSTMKKKKKPRKLGEDNLQSNSSSLKAIAKSESIDDIFGPPKKKVKKEKKKKAKNDMDDIFG
ncbi:hypothetical protein HYPBUDRAFT_153045 [Hyphopichia burtonii NRRL Y-1933]|uniref:RNase MRP protein 1 RNA binding domain-containing protein n=1 Tax=Hyphopichia burtonii NRRL Y-1933 TaxID=984485 RepID=A0A1E4RIS5_9ASCO|nr:hypothetical protein HYPBUDRAFT_153045 [Hyphopichia burtonii NRRL Y-1933]ODV67136.1 hypothetical protein HYPBUDRAFT_153045 [Hyphopichia burtonii NRRL Y-1933]